MYRFFVEPSQIKDNQICISGSDVNHIKKCSAYEAEGGNFNQQRRR